MKVEEKIPIVVCTPPIKSRLRKSPDTYLLIALRARAEILELDVDPPPFRLWPNRKCRLSVRFSGPAAASASQPYTV